MNANKYDNQIRLLVNVLPYVAEEECFALHGGTAINLFVHDMPRLSVDIDLTYLPIEDRTTTLHTIKESLLRISRRISKNFPGIQVQHREDEGKLIITEQQTIVKIEVNPVARGTICPPEQMELCTAAQERYNVFVAMRVVPLGQLYGGKICAALDRQHPRDIFDVKWLLENHGFSDEVRTGFLLCLTSSDRPINEVLFPNFQDQEQAFQNKFEGMTRIEFSYEDFKRTRKKLAETVQASLSKTDKAFLLGFTDGNPDWSIYNFERFPAVQWKLKNILELKENNRKKHLGYYNALKDKLQR